MYPKQPKMVITQIINVPKGTRGRLYRAFGEHRIHNWSYRKLQCDHDASITWILRRYDPPSPSFFLFLKIDRFPPCIKPPSHPIAEANLFFLKSIVSLLA